MTHKQIWIVPLVAVAVVMFAAPARATLPTFTPVSQLTNDAWGNRDPRWSPDGNTILYDHRYGQFWMSSEVYLMDSDGNNRRSVGPSGCNRPSFDATGDNIVYTEFLSSNDYDLWSTPTAGGAHSVVVTAPIRQEAGRYSSTGVLAYDSEYGSNQGYDVWVHSGGPSDPGLRITSGYTDGANYRFPVWSRDSAKLAYSRNNNYSGGTTSSIWTSNADGTDQRELVSVIGSAEAVFWAPDGSSVAYIVYGPDNMSKSLWCVGTSGSDTPQALLTLPDAYVRSADLAPNGIDLVYVAQLPGDAGAGQIWTAVPEPATMSLLALGGVALLKRKK